LAAVIFGELNNGIEIILAAIHLVNGKVFFEEQSSKERSNWSVAKRPQTGCLCCLKKSNN
jgi:hypothetical protein